MLILHATYTSKNPRIGVVEFQLKSIPKEGQIPIYLVTTNKKPQPVEHTAAELEALFENGYIWTITTAEPIVRKPSISEEELMEELFSFLAMLRQIPDEKSQSKTICNCPSCIVERAEMN